MLAIMLCMFGLFRDDFPVKHWLEPCTWHERIYFVPADNDPNMLLKVTKWIPTKRLNYQDFAEYSRQYKYDPNEILDGITDPNLKDVLRKMLNSNGLILNF